MSLYGLSWRSVVRTLCFWWREHGFNPWLLNQDPACRMPTTPAPKVFVKESMWKVDPAHLGRSWAPVIRSSKKDLVHTWLFRNLLLALITCSLFFLPIPDFWLLYYLALACEYLRKRKKNRKMKFHVVLLLVRSSLKRVQKNIVESKGIETTGQKVLFFIYSILHCCR